MKMVRSRIGAVPVREISPGRVGVALGLLLLLAGCSAARIQARPPLEDRGAAYLYLRPIPAEAARLSFTLEGVAAIKESGEEIPLTLRIGELSVGKVFRERLLADGDLPPGRYIGISFQVKSASLAGSEDNAAVQWAEEPERIDTAFVVARKKANVLSLAFRYGESLPGGVIFKPRFTIVPAGKPPRELLGCVASRGSNTVTIFNKMTGEVSTVIATGAAPGGMAVDSLPRSLAYVVVSGEDAVEVIDLLQGEVIDRIRLRMGDQPVEAALTPDGKTLLIMNAGSNTISFIDTVSRDEQVRIDLPNGPRSILLDVEGRRAYVFNTLGSGISVIDIPNRALVATIPTESGPLRGQFNRQGNRLYVIHRWSPYLLVVDPFTLAVARRQHVGMGFQALTVDPALDRIYMARGGGNDVEVLDPFTLVAVNFLRVESEVSFMAVDGREKSLLLLMPGKGTLRIVDLIRSATRAEVDVGEEPVWVTLGTGER